MHLHRPHHPFQFRQIRLLQLNLFHILLHPRDRRAPRNGYHRRISRLLPLRNHPRQRNLWHRVSRPARDRLDLPHELDVQIEHLGCKSRKHTTRVVLREIRQ